MNDPFWMEVAKQMPSLGVLAWLVVSFLKHLKEDNDRRERIEETRAATLKTINDSCHAFQRETSVHTHEALGRVVVALDNNSAALGYNSSKRNGGLI